MRPVDLRDTVRGDEKPADKPAAVQSELPAVRFWSPHNPDHCKPEAMHDLFGPQMEAYEPVTLEPRRLRNRTSSKVFQVLELDLSAAQTSPFLFLED